MQVQLSGNLDACWPRVAEAIDAARFHLESVGERAWLASARGASCQVWLRAADNEHGVLLTVWLPDEGDTASRDRLVKALEQCHCGGESPDDSLLRRLRRIEGQIRGLQRMIETGRECDAVLTQFSAVNAALKQTAALMVSAHLVQCIRAELDSGGDGTAVNQRLLNILF
ncbi:MAG: metal-sensitive transcriptional regulator [Armatimonadetes bacterium]|nr:metal-sensitive transcriptional regulator [Armatimonadota bacterium]